MLVGIEGSVEVVLESDVGALGVAAWGLDRTAAAVCPVDLLGLPDGVEPLHHALPPYPVKFSVERRGGPDEVVGEVGPPEIFKVDCPEPPA